MRVLCVLGEVERQFDLLDCGCRYDERAVEYIHLCDEHNPEIIVPLPLSRWQRLWKSFDIGFKRMVRKQHRKDAAIT